MSTSSTEQAVESNTWTTRSKKEMLLGLVVTIANIGTEPIFSTLGNGLLYTLPAFYCHRGLYYHSWLSSATVRKIRSPYHLSTYNISQLLNLSQRQKTVACNVL